ncbi:sensor histidine kinase [Paenibacillaceae bacterium WGS1546]|uniref:sensor histidine kinase n=1 Tax=Cohnella sp. WGS1546 TaxID=3366810 RepID=UPI00372D299D
MKTIMEPARFAHGWRFLNIGVLVHLWIVGEPTIGSFILILLLLAMVSLRWRFRLPAWTVLIDACICFAYIPHTELSLYGLALPIFELAVAGKWPISLLFFVQLLLSATPGLLFWHYVQAFFVGCYSRAIIKNERKYKLEADEQRRARYELERLKADLLEANRTAALQAELAERYRISRQLHDHLGHDLTGASLALQAYEYVQDPEEARQLLREVNQRLERSTQRLRDTVHNLTPTASIGVENLEYVIRNFGRVDIRFRKSGDMSLVPAYGWGLLEACLKEALTNVARHSDATEVETELHVTDSIVRLRIQDNGSAIKNDRAGSGLRSLQMRARAIGGSLSVSRQQGFLLVCVIPIERRGEGE